MAEIVEQHKELIPKQPGEKGTLKNIEVTIVLTEDMQGKLAAYKGISDDPEWVAKFGTKLTPRQAKSHYPALDPDNYRL